MSYYDDSFRDKMESLVSSYTPDKPEADITGKARGSIRPIPAGVEKSEDSPAPESDAVKEDLKGSETSS